MADGGPGVTFTHKGLAAFAHGLPFGIGEGEDGTQGLHEGLHANLNPPTAVVRAQLFPGGADSGDDGRGGGEGFDDHGAEVFGVGGQDEELGVGVERVFLWSVDGAEVGDGGLVQSCGVGPRDDVIGMRAIGGAGDEEPPTFRPQAGPGINEVKKAFLGVDARDEEGDLGTFGMRGRLNSREVDSQGNDCGGTAQTNTAAVLYFAGRGRVQQGGPAQTPPLVERQGKAFLERTLREGPRREHAVGRPDDGDAAALGPEEGAEEPGRPECVDVHHIGAPIGGRGGEDGDGRGIVVRGRMAHPQATVVSAFGERAQGLAAEDGGAGRTGHPGDDVENLHLSPGNSGRVGPNLRWCRPCSDGGFRGPWRGVPRRAGAWRRRRPR